MTQSWVERTIEQSVGTTEEAIGTWSCIRAGIGNLNRGLFRDVWVTSSRPYGDFHLSDLYPGLRPDKFSRPCGDSLSILLTPKEQSG